MRTYIFFIIVIFIAGCSATEQTVTKEEIPVEEEIYVFDDIERDAVELENQIIEATKEMSYVVQVGAFSSKDKAEQFVKENQSKIHQQMSIIFKEDINLFAVQLPALETKDEAETLRNKLWQIPVFNDAFIITQEK